MRPAEMFLGQLEKRKEVAPGLWRWLVGGVSLAAAAGLALVLVPQDVERIRKKGAPVAVIYKRGAAEPRPVAEGEVLRPKDALRFISTGAEPTYVGVVERDGKGAIAVFVPFGGGPAVRLEAGAPAPGSVALDEVPGRSTLLLLTGPEPFEVGTYADALKTSPAGELPRPPCARCSVDVLRYEKVP